MKIAPEVLSVVVPFLIIQPLVENAVKHGLASKPSGGCVTVIAQDYGTEALISVEDDGVGITQPYISGLGITSMRRRADALDGALQLLPRPAGGTILTATLRSHP